MRDALHVERQCQCLPAATHVVVRIACRELVVVDVADLLGSELLRTEEVAVAHSCVAKNNLTGRTVGNQVAGPAAWSVLERANVEQQVRVLCLGIAQHVVGHLQAGIPCDGGQLTAVGEEAVASFLDAVGYSYGDDVHALESLGGQLVASQRGIGEVEVTQRRE